MVESTSLEAKHTATYQGFESLLLRHLSSIDFLNLYMSYVMKSLNILVTGGLGYIGSHCVVSLLEKGYNVIIVDNLSNSSIDVLASIMKITLKPPIYYNIDINDKDALKQVFANHDISWVIHFAAYKAVGESVEKPLKYYDNNIGGTNTLLLIMKHFGVKNIIFSSSATVYKALDNRGLVENDECMPVNPYGRTKYFIEQLLQDVFNSDNFFKIGVLRYFNPVGAHKSGYIGENPKGIPNNLMPYILKVAIKELPYLNIFGNDYLTKDGTGIRDYIHILDLIDGHIKTLEYLENNNNQLIILNLGTGIPYSVLDIVNTFSKVNNIEIPYKIVARRLGDAPICYANPSYANQIIGFKAKYNLVDMCIDSWSWQKSFFNAI